MVPTAQVIPSRLTTNRDQRSPKETANCLGEPGKRDGSTTQANRSRVPGARVPLAALFALVQAWLGLTLAFYTDWPTSFWITALAALVYGASLLARR